MNYEFTMPKTTGPLHERRESRVMLAEAIEEMSNDTGYKFGPRGWAYYAEGLGLITKGEFARFEKLLTDMRKAGELDPNVIEADVSRIATTVHDYEASSYEPEGFARYAVDQIKPELESWANSFHEIGYWDNLDYYVEMIVEKKDLLQIFQDTANRHKVRITNGKGDTDIHSRLAILERFRDHSYEGRRPILLAIGDHDPKGLDIVTGLKRTLMSCVNLKGLEWDDPDFDVVNIGLTADQINEMGLMKIPNLETGGGKDLADRKHADHYKPYVQDYINTHGVWKVEANALVSNPDGAIQLFEDALSEFIPNDHWIDRREENSEGRSAVREEIEQLMKTWTFND